MEAILANIDPLIAALISDSESNPTAKAILSFISTFQFLATIHSLDDVLVLLSRLSKTFQRQCVLILPQFLMVLSLLWPHFI